MNLLFKVDEIEMMGNANNFNVLTLAKDQAVCEKKELTLTNDVIHLTDLDCFNCSYCWPEKFLEENF